MFFYFDVASKQENIYSGT